MEQHPSSESFETILLDPCQVFFAYEGDNLTLTLSDGTFYPRVSLRRSFPLSSENTDIIVRIPEEDCERSYELGMLANINELEDCSMEAVSRELRLHYVVPLVLRIHSIREEFGFLYWVVETDRGRKEFTMRDSIVSSTRQVSKGRWLLIDINQTRYEIHNFDSLDLQSQNLLRRHLLL